MNQRIFKGYGRNESCDNHNYTVNNYRNQHNRVLGSIFVQQGNPFDDISCYCTWS